MLEFNVLSGPERRILGTKVKGARKPRGRKRVFSFTAREDQSGFFEPGSVLCRSRRC